MAQEKYLVKNAKNIGLLLLGLAAQKYGKSLDKEQEILVNIADILSNVYAMESVVLRTEKAIHKVGLKKVSKSSFIHRFFAKRLLQIEQDAKETLIAVEQGDTLRLMLSVLRKFTRHTPSNVIAKKREVADRFRRNVLQFKG